MNTVATSTGLGPLEQRRALLEARLRSAANEHHIGPLSFAQQRLWFLDQLEPNSALYNIPVVLRLTGKLNVQALQQALDTIVERHEALRTRFECTGESPGQLVDEHISVRIRTIDLRSLAADRKDAETTRLIRDEANRPFDLSQDQLLRASLVRTEDEEHILMLTIHHIVSDEWSIKVLFRELAACYEAALQGRSPTLPQLPIQYADYALWQRDYLKGDVLQKQLRYWNEKLSGNPPVLELPSDHPRHSLPTFRGASRKQLLGLELTNAVRELANRNQATPFMVLLAAFKALLHRYTRQEDIVVGSPIAGRNRMETEGLIGFFVNTLALRTRLENNPTFSELLMRVRETVLGAQANQDLPFEKLVEELHPERSLTHLPFTKVMFSVQTGLFEQMEWPALKLEFLEPPTETAKFEITCFVVESSQGLVARVEYNTDLFEAATIDRLLEHYVTLLKGGVAEPGRRLSELPLLTDAERTRLLVEWNDTATDYPRTQCIHQLFEQQAASNPQGTAVVFGKERLTYRQLNEHANQLANYLRELGIGPGVPVGICVQRSVEMLVGLLGILKAGGVYVPLDANYPKDRLEFMLADAATPVLLTQQRLLAHVPHNTGKVVCLDADWELIGRRKWQNLPNSVGPESLAYIMFTSGSTGQPKGVAVPHRAVVRLVRNTNYIRFDSTDRVAQVSNVSFDAATFEIWGALLNGGQLIGITKDVALMPKDFARELREKGITSMFLTSALFNQLASEVPGAFQTLRTVIAGGEALDPKWIRAVLQHHPPQALVNGYGPTENTTFSCCFRIDKVDPSATNIPIGPPISNTTAYVLDPHRNLVPIGVPGELYLGGDGLAQGYWNRDALTAERFVPDPFSTGGQRKLYRTGDLVRYLPNGSIEFLGRIDDQVKIRGFRIELGEIETILGHHLGVRECVVKVCGNGSGHKRLAAYFVPGTDPAPNASELRSFLQEKLPDYMVPSAFVQMSALPLTPNGKVDRNALPEPDSGRPELEKKYAAPRDEVEVELTRIWENILGIQPIGIEDKFFDLGGHSLLAVRVIGQIEKRFGKKLRVATIFQAPTIERLAAIIREEIKESSITAGTSLVEIQSKGERRPLFFVHGAGGGMFWGYANLARHLGNHQPIYAFKSRGSDGREEFARIEDMAAQYVADLKVIQPTGPYNLGGYCFGGNVAFEMARQLEAQGERVGLLALMNCAPPNSKYVKANPTPVWCWRFVRNLVCWGKYFRQWSPSQRQEFFRWKWNMVKKKFARKKEGKPSQAAKIDAGNLVDLTSYSPEQRRLWEAHIRALLAYRPQRFGGQLHLFRSPVHPLLCSFDPDYGWADFAAGGVHITVVPGAHEKILEDPCVPVLAAKLASFLAKAEPSQPASGTRAPEPRPAPHEVPRLETPLSFAQQRSWVLYQLENGNSAYHQVGVFRLKGPVKQQLLEQALEDVRASQPALRTVFPTKDQQPFAKIQEDLPPFRLERLDCAALPPAARQAEMLRAAELANRPPFDVAREPLIRATLLDFGPDEGALILVLHQLVADEQSLEIIQHQLCERYAARLANQDNPDKSPRRDRRPNSPPTPRLSFANWDAHLAFWKAQLADAPALLELPTDFSRPATPSYRGGTHRRLLSADLTAHIRSWSKHGNDERCAYLASVAALLHRYSRQEDIVIGESCDSRDFETGELVGNLTNFIPLRIDLSTNPTVEQLVDRVRLRRQEAFSHVLPFEKIIEDLQPARDQSYHPIFQVRFSADKFNPKAIADNLIESVLLSQRATKWDLSFHLSETAAGIELRIEYALDLFNAATVDRLLGHWETLLAGMVASPNVPVAALPLLSQRERHQLLVDWNSTEKEFPREKTLFELFAEQAQRTPDAEALVAGVTRLTYQELHQRSLQLANHLRAIGVGNRTLVGICLDRSWEMVVAILGTLQAGAAYVPMDPAYPAERLAFMAEDSKARVLLTQRKLEHLLPQTNAQLIYVEELDWSTQLEPTEQQNTRHCEPCNLAYVIYTSGSTGKPKGVAIEHRNAVAFVYWARDIFGQEELSGVLAATSICFDLSIFEMFVPLSWGGKVILAENALALPGLPVANEVKLINTVPSAIRELLRVKGVPPSVQIVNLAGEPLPTTLVDQIYAETGVQKVYDLYGPTETTTYSTFTLRKPGERATIGRPLANEQIYLLDQNQELVPIGVPGELYIGGEGVARGYLHRPELTAERFISNPFKPGDRLYRTGDLARWRADGILEYLGRIDHQVKIRGFRVELGEIEAVLKKQPGVREAIVVAREDQPGLKRLVAYIAAAGGHQTTERLRAAIKSCLPDYMVPSALVFLDALPLTPNGKIDRKALPAPEQDRSGSGYVAPRNSTEERIAQIWSEVLQLRKIGVHDNFFDLGGHSLFAIQVVSRLREMFNIEFPLLMLFDAPTIEALAVAIDSGKWKTQQAQPPPLQRVPRTADLPLSFVQERLWFIDQLEPGSHAYHVPLAIRLRGQLDVPALKAAVQKVTRRHEALRTTFRCIAGELSQVIHPDNLSQLAIVDLRSTPAIDRESRLKEILQTEACEPFDLARGPLMRLTLVRVDETDHALLVVMHHAVSDGWSLGIFFRELAAIYNAQLGGTPATLDELPVQYADYAAWQRRWMQGPVLETEIAYWKDHLAGAPPAVRLPTDSIPPAKADGKAHRVTCTIPRELTEAMAEFNQQEGTTPFMLLMAALTATFHKWTGQNDLVVGTVVAGRNRSEVENVIGCYMNFLPIRLQLDGVETGRELLAHTKSAVLAAQSHQECPFEKIVEAVNPERAQNRNPLYNVALLLQNFPAEPFTAKGLTASVLPLSLEAALLDLRFEAEPSAEGLVLACEYRTELFKQSTIEQLLAEYLQTFEELLHSPTAGFRKPKAPDQSPNKAEDAPSLTVAVSGTFTVEPIAEPMQFWATKLGLAAEIKFAPYNQVFQQLLDPQSLLATNPGGMNVLLLRLEDWSRGADAADHNDKGARMERIRRNAAEFITAAKGACSRSTTPFLVCLCPPSPSLTSDPEWKSFLNTLEAQLVADCEAIPGLRAISSATLGKLYPVADYYDQSGDELGNVPYTPLFFSALGTVIARQLHAQTRTRYKVIVLDCDQTLWSGVCGEDGPNGICLDEPRQALQQFMRAQNEAGMVLCLCSKNNEEDVREVFAQRLDMPLRHEHFTASRLNWAPKSENLKSLARQLQLGLDSFIFLDDNPVECAEVEAHCPEVLTLQLPEDPAQIPHFLEHCWVFDHLKLTSEDRRRVELYRQNEERNRLRTEAGNLAEFIAGLDLKITIEPLKAADVTRVSQLTFRTNQFNLTTRRRTEAEIQALADTHIVLCVSVADRFGDYGLTGVLICQPETDALVVDTFLLSCRVLGRGVEHRMLARLGEIAHELGVSWVDVHFTKSAKNKPAHDFLEAVGSRFSQALNGGYLYRFPVAEAAETQFSPAQLPELVPEAAPTTSPTAVSAAVARKFTACRMIALSLNDPASIHRAIETTKAPRTAPSQGYVAPRSDLERQLCEVWQQLLRLDRVGVKENFFELGGHSLLAVRLFAQLERITGLKLPLVTLFQSPTIEELAKVIEQGPAKVSRSLLVPIQPNGSKPPLFLVHGAGGDVLWGYANLAALMPSDQPIYGIKSRGQVGLEEFTTLEGMASNYLEEIRGLQPHGPYWLGGYCFGGNVAYEMARQLQARGETVALVALLDAAPSNTGYESMRWWSPAFACRFLRNFYYWLGDFMVLKPSERKEYIARKTRALGRKLAARFNPKAPSLGFDLEDVIEVSHFPEHELKLWRIHLQALVTHVEQPYDGPITLFRTRGQPLFCSLEPDFCWSSLARGGVSVRHIPGSHENIFVAPNVHALARELQACLDQQTDRNKHPIHPDPVTG